MQLSLNNCFKILDNQKSSKMNILIPIAGKGSRFLLESQRNPEYKKPKPLINIAGHEMVKWAISSLPLKSEDKLIFIVLKEHIDSSQIDEKLIKIYPSCKIIIVDEVTEGAACTALLAKDFINNDEPLIVSDCDQYIEGDSIFKEIEKYRKGVDGVIPIFYANNPKWSFSKTNKEGFVIEVAEKIQISRNANIGAYYFKKGRDFVWAAEEMIEENDRVNGEFYIAPIYNYLIRRGKKIVLTRPKFVHGLGTPKDVEKFIEFLKIGDVESKLEIKFNKNDEIEEEEEIEEDLEFQNTRLNI